MTLMELLIALVLLSMIVLGIMNLEIFCKHVFTGTDRKTKVTNEATYIVEHMSKFIGRAIGDASDFPLDDTPAITGCDELILAWTKANIASAGKDTGDRQIAYCFNNTSHTVRYYPQYRTWPDTVTTDAANEVLSRNTIECNPVFGTNMNYVDLTVTTCWNASITPCGSVDNPRITLQTRISMPSVSINATTP